MGTLFNVTYVLAAAAFTCSLAFIRDSDHYGKAGSEGKLSVICPGAVSNIACQMSLCC